MILVLYFIPKDIDRPPRDMIYIIVDLANNYPYGELRNTVELENLAGNKIGWVDGMPLN